MSIRKLSYLVPALVSVGSVVSSAASELPIACEKSVAYRKGGAGAGNGGEIEETKFRITLQKLSRFVSTTEGKKLFPEVDPLHFATVANNAAIRMKEVKSEADVIRDRFGNPRTCAWNDVDCSITCDGKSFSAEVAKDPTAPFVLALHEALGLLDVERGTKENPSDTTTSERIIPYVKQVVEYDLSFEDDSLNRLRFIDLGFHCYEREDVETKSGKKKFKLLTFDADGSVKLWGVSEPDKYSFYFLQQCADENGECPEFVRAKKRMIRKGQLPKATLLAEGRIDPKEPRWLTMKNTAGQGAIGVSLGIDPTFQVGYFKNPGQFKEHLMNLVSEGKAFSYRSEPEAREASVEYRTETRMSCSTQPTLALYSLKAALRWSER